MKIDAGVLRITNKRTLEMWKKNGKYQQLINEDLIYSFGCGRFRNFLCVCCKCKKITPTKTN